jgi:SAM-dependent methyltransferase
MNLLSKIRLSKEKDVFYDLGCGYGRLCIWIAPRVKLAIGYENHYDRFKRAKRAAEESGYENILIKNSDFSFASYNKATIIYSIVDIGLQVMTRINKQSKPGTRLILYKRPNYPIKGSRISGNYFIMRTPFKRAKDQNEFAKMVLDQRNVTIDDLYKKLGAEDTKDLKREIRESENAWKKFLH